MSRLSTSRCGAGLSAFAAGLALALSPFTIAASPSDVPTISIEPPASQLVGPGTGLEPVWTITNRSDVAARVRVEWSPGRTWPWARSVVLDLPAHGVTGFVTPGSVPDTAGAGEVPIVARVGREGEGLVADSCTLVLVVLEAPPAAVVLERVPDRVRLEWRTRMPQHQMGIVERSREVGPWMPVGGIRADETGFCVFEDHDVIPGGTYHYRLREWIHSMTMVSAVTTVDVPDFAPLKVTGLSPNPGRGLSAVVFTLPARDATRLEVFDAAGRRVWSRDLGTLAPGPHRQVLDAEGALRPGLYLIRITQGNLSADARAVIVR